MSYFNILGLTKEAERVGKEALQHSNDPSLMFNLANILGKQDKFKESEAALCLSNGNSFLEFHC
jgi:hypothetical protein